MGSEKFVMIVYEFTISLNRAPSLNYHFIFVFPHLQQTLWEMQRYAALMAK